MNEVSNYSDAESCEAYLAEEEAGVHHMHATRLVGAPAERECDKRKSTSEFNKANKKMPSCRLESDYLPKDENSLNK
ncbi:hypothetical protein EBO34_02555 [Alteribacter keqinensis]|uniref:Uncharacterized protein n=1 Tax=Alteribacter keqinensis TaxID=2483800 RepID=A0A3M7TWS4_9BACI|nr:hypothetical protein EBO34_02555 [Alteribacter keqinensis]